MGLKTAGVGHFTIPTAPVGGTSVTSGSANVFTTTYVALSASAPSALFITGIHLEAAAAKAATYIIVQLATGTAGSEAVIGQYLVPLSTASTVALGYRQIYPPILVANGTRIAAKTADSVGGAATLITLECIAQANVVDDGVAVGSVSGSVGSVTGSVGSVTGAVGSVTGAVGSVTGAVGSVTGAVGSVTAAITLPTIPANWITAAGINASALNGKGDWNIGKTGYTLTQAFPTNFSSLAVTAGGAVTAGTVSDKTGYALTQAFPANFSALGVTAGGLVDITQASADKAWSTAARTLTAGTNIVLAKGVGVTGFNDIAATDVWGSVTRSLTDKVGYALSAPYDPAKTAAQAGDAMALTASERLSVADAHLNRDLSLVSDTNARSPLNALRFIRNKWSLVAGVLTVTKEDDTTSAWTATVTSTPGANPVTGNDPT